jgi:hypothetical protein
MDGHSILHTVLVLCIYLLLHAGSAPPKGSVVSNPACQNPCPLILCVATHKRLQRHAHRRSHERGKRVCMCKPAHVQGAHKVGMACGAKEPLTLPAAHMWGPLVPAARPCSLTSRTAALASARVTVASTGQARRSKRAPQGTVKRQASRPALTRGKRCSEVTHPAR